MERDREREREILNRWFCGLGLKMGEGIGEKLNDGAV